MKTLFRPLFIIGLMLFPFLVPLQAEPFSDPSTIKIAGTTIQLSEPAGFFRYDGKSPKVDAFNKRALPTTNRLLAAFGSEDDLAKVLSNSLPHLTRSFNAQSIIKLEPFNVLPANFIELKDATRQQITTKFQRLGPKAAEIASSVSSSLTNELQTRTDFTVGEMIPLGIFDETVDSISYSMLMKSSITIGRDTPVVTVSVGSVCAMAVRERVLYLYCTSTYRDRQDIAWVRSEAKKWRDAIRQANAPAK